jgi:DNA modification methylase
MDTKQIAESAVHAWQEAQRAAESEESRQAGGPGSDLAAARFAERKDAAGALYLGDNLKVMAALAVEIKAGGQKPAGLIYMDPPYFTNKDYTARIRVETEGEAAYIQVPAFRDTWKREAVSGIDAYLQMLAPRLIAARELLADDGCLWLHLDRRAVHYAKVICDEIFDGPDHLINEVIWTYKSGGSSKRRFANKHDTLLYYAKNKKRYKFFPLEEKSYNRALKPYRFKGVKEYRDDFGWYTVVNMKDIWEIPMVGRTAGERTGYAAQKPEALLERIVLACTEPGDLCIDPFCGSGTLAAVCERHGRPWICIDESPLALELAAGRLGLHNLHL